MTRRGLLSGFCSDVSRFCGLPVSRSPGLPVSRSPGPSLHRGWGPAMPSAALVLSKDSRPRRSPRTSARGWCSRAIEGERPGRCSGAVVGREQAFTPAGQSLNGPERTLTIISVASAAPSSAVGCKLDSIMPVAMTGIGVRPGRREQLPGEGCSTAATRQDRPSAQLMPSARERGLLSASLVR
ncbi:hypothetical protein AWB68_03005 [Caballeronia choica]|uniref:Uncharacterized protein n=1 Tax=Caballeronia choica TaxID=326476 RepID=A0A158IT48_9BURK|nr:hypothetical protein AWB68_03005 [Caballeronia choica]